MNASIDEQVVDGKWGKLVRNLANAYLALTNLSVQEASCEPEDRRFMADVNEEAADVLEAAAISARMVGKRNLREQISRLREPGWATKEPVTDETRSYPSTWQDLTAQRGNVEVDHFNGAIVRLGEQYGIATPLNRVLRDRCSAANNTAWNRNSRVAPFGRFVVCPEGFEPTRPVKSRGLSPVSAIIRADVTRRLSLSPESSKAPS